MKLYGNTASPFVRKVRILAHELGIVDRIALTTVTGHPTDPGALRTVANPLGKVPALERPEGATLYDSRVICRFLDAEHGARFYPAPPALWDSLVLEATADGVLDAAVLMVYEGRSRPEDKRHAPWVEAQWDKIGRALDAVEARWMPNLLAPFEIGHIAMGTALGYLDFRHGDRDWRGARPQLAAWYGRVLERPSFQATQPA